MMAPGDEESPLPPAKLPPELLVCLQTQRAQEETGLATATWI